MPKKNKYAKRAKISEAKFRQLLKLFALDLSIVQMKNLTGLNRNTVNRYVTEIRSRIALYCEAQSPFEGEVEVDESFFGTRRVKGKRGRGALGKTIVFGIFKRNGRVYTEVVPDRKRAPLQAVIRGRVNPGSFVHSDGWRGCNGLVDLGYKKHFRFDHGNNEFAQGKTHINGIESFWAFAKTRLSKYKGMSRRTFSLHLKECEFRFNNRDQDLYKLLLKMFRENPLF